MFQEEKAILRSTERGPHKMPSLNFDSLDGKLDEKMKTFNLEEKGTKKYSAVESQEMPKEPSPPLSTLSTQPVNKKFESFQKVNQTSSTQSLNLHLGKKAEIAGEEVYRSNSEEKVGMGLYETANILCNLVDISHDSMLKRSPNINGPKGKKMVRQRTQGEMEKRPSQTGPFSSIKESTEQRKKIREEDSE
ncbi:unnamed protein product, partial [Mesorhabditis belari]|uniref:Uncharacterized protein n=1 Tax=Mesorhabditis belari TaxID=2138241 RepID=A0AAF3EB25_9BILA